MKDIFDSYENATVYYCPNADRIFIYHRATFLMLPCLEREDGRKLILESPEAVFEAEGLKMDHRFKILKLGDL